MELKRIFQYKSRSPTIPLSLLWRPNNIALEFTSEVKFVLLTVKQAGTAAGNICQSAQIEKLCWK